MKQLGSVCSIHFGRVSNKPDFWQAMGYQLLIIVTLTDNLIVLLLRLRVSSASTIAEN